MLSLLTFLLALSVCALLALCLVYALLVHRSLCHHLSYRRQGIPCAPFRPISGHLSELFLYDQQDRMLDMWRHQHAQYGAVHAIGFGPQISLKLNDPQYLRDVLRLQADCYRKSDDTRMFLEPSVGEHNLLLTEGAEHARHRGILAPAFHHSNLLDMVELVVDEASAGLDSWVERMTADDGQAGGDAASRCLVTDLRAEMSHLTFNVIACCAFGRGFSSVPDASSTISQALVFIGRMTLQRTIRLVGLLPVLRELPLWGKREISEQRRRMFAVVERVVRERKEGRKGEGLQGQHDLLDLLLQTRDATTGGGLSEQEVRDEAISMLVAGHETVSNLLCWQLTAMMRYPDVWDDCVREVDAVCGSQPPTAAQLQQLPVIDAVISETLRLYPPAPIISKTVLRPHCIRPSAASSSKPPIQLPAEATVHIDLHVIHRLKEYWGEDADSFDYRRWLQPGKRPHSDAFAFLPFSHGVRNCIGQVRQRQRGSSRSSAAVRSLCCAADAALC